MIIPVLLLVGCDKIEQLWSTKASDLKTVKIGFARVSVNIPKKYERVEPDDLINRILETDTIYGERRAARFEKMKAAGPAFMIYVDTADINNLIYFMDGDHVRLTSELVKYWVPRLEQTLESDWSEEGIHFKRIDNQFYPGRTTQLLKLKYELTRTEQLGYSTMYLISTSTNTFGVFVSGSANEDYEELFSKIKIQR